MIDARELRIGNYVLLPNGKECKVERSDFEYTLGLTNLEDYKPVLLTEQWLIDFGFEKGPRYYSLGNFDVDLTQWYGFNDMVAKCPLKYVHQLQNLYFALTGKELTKK